jgi:hypothetical protein
VNVSVVIYDRIASASRPNKGIELTARR